MTERITSTDLRSAIITMCQDYGFTTDRTYELIDEVIDSIRGSDDIPTVTPLDTVDYCTVCAETTGNPATMTQWADEKCLCCGRDWGEENGTCRGRHINGKVWFELLDAVIEPN